MSVVTPRIFFRGVIQIHVEEINKDLLVNNIFLFYFDYYDDTMRSFLITHDPKEDFSSQQEFF